MKITTALLGLLLVLSANSLVQAQTTEKIALYADQAGTDCSISDTRVRTIIVYMIHLGSGSRSYDVFRAPKPECWTGATWVGEVINAFVFSGSTQGAGVEVGYGPCMPLPIYVGKMFYEATGAAQECCTYPVLPHGYPALYLPPGILTLECQGSHYIPIIGGSAVINENSSCPCAPPLAVNSATWGRIKSLYH